MIAPPVIPLDLIDSQVLALPVDLPVIVVGCPALVTGNPQTLRRAEALDKILTTAGRSTRIAIELTGPGITPTRLWNLIERLNAQRFAACWRFTSGDACFSPSAVIPPLAGKLLVVFIESGVAPSVRLEIEQRLAGVGRSSAVVQSVIQATQS